MGAMRRSRERLRSPVSATHGKDRDRDVTTIDS